MNKHSHQSVKTDRPQVQRWLTADIAILLGAFLGLGLAFRGPNPDVLSMALSSGIGAVAGFALSRILRRFGLRARVIAIIITLLVLLPLFGSAVYRLGE